ncbi:metallophosphoesterase [Lentisphaerota bacterium ZTH]|nr:bifunctional metallophosphatase/5'-nucleotidase [Lentisphaerota bacterium]WET05328.1 metallophosphoesterase [Lentisphaerota bacterium ZTH]
MKESLVLILLLVTSFFNVWGQVRCADLDDNSSHSRVTRDFVRIKKWSLTDEHEAVLPPNPALNLISEVPCVGTFNSDGSYNFRQKLLIVNLNGKALDLLPRHMRRDLIPRTHQFQNMLGIINDNNLRCRIRAVITGKGSHHNNETMVGRKFNMSFHGLVSSRFSQDTVSFSYSIPAGMFIPKGILAADMHTIPMERTDALNISCNNIGSGGKLGLSSAGPNFVTIAEVSSCWSAAKVGRHGDDIIITYNLLLNTPQVSDAVKEAVDNDDFFNMLSDIKKVAADINLDEFSAGVLRTWADDLIHISQPDNPERMTKKLYIISTNDLHQHETYVPKIKRFMNWFRTQHASPVIWLDAGDFLEFYEEYRGTMSDEQTFEWLSHCDACTLGNHEYYKGLDYLADLSWKYKMPFVCSNIEAYPTDKRPLHVIGENLNGPAIIERQGRKIGIVGVCSPKLDYLYLYNKDSTLKVSLYNTPKIRNDIKWLRKRCDFVVMLTHQNNDLDEDAAANFGVDAVIGGHSHSMISSDYNVSHSVVTKAGWMGEFIGVTTVKKELINGEWRTSSSSYLIDMKDYDI